MPKMSSICEVLNAIARTYPKDMVPGQLKDISRIAFNIRIALQAVSPKAASDIELCDLGGGIGLFSVSCAALGVKRTVLVDDFKDAVNERLGASILDLHRRQGVEVISRDVVSSGIRDIEGTFDVITTFDSMEHWHHSPKRLFGEVVEKLKPGGVFVLGAPNRANLKKRIGLLFGKGAWSHIHDWYETETFRGHVREPDVDDLKYIACDLGLAEIAIYGRNWLGYHSPNMLLRFAARVIDYPLRSVPTLCSDIYLVGRKMHPDCGDGK
jgi:2-polyprenyl-3-methyl-5-hydroxy-6-metoxy-1,4-benzoquinol methylase